MENKNTGSFSEDPLSLDALSKEVAEGDATDPLTLTNLILNKDAKKVGFDWVSQQENRPKSAGEIFAEAPTKVDKEGEFEQDKPVRVKKLGEAEAPLNVETNNNDKTVMSSDPKFNMCPAYLGGICRVTGNPCAYSNLDYKECGITFLAISGDPMLFQIPPGREDSEEYAQGIKS